MTTPVERGSLRELLLCGRSADVSYLQVMNGMQVGSVGSGNGCVGEGVGELDDDGLCVWVGRGDDGGVDVGVGVG